MKQWVKEWIDPPRVVRETAWGLALGVGTGIALWVLFTLTGVCL